MTTEFENVKEATGYVALCPHACGWRSNLCTSAQDAKESLDHHVGVDHPEIEVV